MTTVHFEEHLCSEILSEWFSKCDLVEHYPASGYIWEIEKIIIILMSFVPINPYYSGSK